MARRPTLTKTRLKEIENAMTDLMADLAGASNSLEGMAHDFTDAADLHEAASTASALARSAAHLSVMLLSTGRMIRQREEIERLKAK